MESRMVTLKNPMSVNRKPEKAQSPRLEAVTRDDQSGQEHAHLDEPALERVRASDPGFPTWWRRATVHPQPARKSPGSPTLALKLEIGIPHATTDHRAVSQREFYLAVRADAEALERGRRD